jgi:hypothetical protein
MHHCDRDLPLVDTLDEIISLLDEKFEFFFARSKNKKYKNVAEYSEKRVLADPFLKYLLEKTNKKFGLFEKGYLLDKLWLVETSHMSVNTNELPYVPHIDYKRYLKVMIYVDDVTEANGPFSAVTTNPDDFEDLRLSLKHDYKLDKKNQIDQFLAEEYRAFTGTKGTMILFDTNCPHFAAAVSPGNRRRVFRFDYELPEWRRKESALSKLSKFASRIRS